MILSKKYYSVELKFLLLFVLALNIGTLLVLNGKVLPTAHAQTVGFCWEHDYDDHGKRYCKNFQTIDELKQRHIRLRKACQNAHKCSVVQYIRFENRYFYHGIKVCNTSNTGDSTFVLVTDHDTNTGYYGTSSVKKHANSCQENHDKFTNFFRDDQTYLIIERGNLKYGGVMPK